MLSPKLLSSQQRTAIKDILNKKVMCITSDCGFGKTVVNLTAFATSLKKYPENKMLVVCTPEGVKKTWSQEHKKWTHLKHLKVVPLLGTPKERCSLLQKGGDVFVITYNNLKWLVENNNYINFNFVCADEGECLKGATSKWRKFLIKSAPNARWRIIATATPKARGVEDYWGLCKYLDNGDCLNAPTITEFRALYMTQIVNGNNRFYIMKKKSIPIVEDKIKHLFVNYELSEQAEIPIKAITVRVNLTEESAKKYQTLEREQCLNSLTPLDDEEPLDSLALSSKLDQLSSGFLYVDDSLRISQEQLLNTTNAKELLSKTSGRKTIDVFDDRVRALDMLIKKIHNKHGDKPIIICYYYTHEKKQLQGLLGDVLSDTDDDFVTKWNSGKFNFLLLQYSRSSKSLNLQDGGNIMIFYSPTFKWVDDYQIIRRIARQGQKEKCVYAYRLYLNGTIDDVKTKRLDERFQGHKRFQSKIMKRLQT